MQLSGKLSEEDFTDARRLSRAKRHWLKTVAVNWYGILLLCAIAWSTAAGLMGSTHPNWLGVGVLWAVLIAIVAYVFYKRKGAIERQFSRVSAAVPDWITLLNDGVKLDGPGGATSFRPWSHFQGCREGKRVMLLYTRNGSTLILPVAGLPEMERESLRQTLAPHVSVASPQTAHEF
jgi:hypothetical protein